MNGVGTPWGTIVETVTRGSDDPRIVAITFAVLAVALGLVVTVVLLVSSLNRSSKVRGPGLPGTAGRGNRFLVPAIMASVLVLVAVSSTYAGRSQTCAHCHEDTPATRTGTPHETLACIRCHREPGVFGFVVGHADVARWVAVTAAGGWQVPERGQRASISSRACLRCHDGIRSGIVTDGVIRVRHASFPERPCTDCHNTIAHGAHVPMPVRPDMRICLTCHDARQVAADCTTCHIGDVALAARRATPRTPAIKTAARTGTDCRGCHETDSCNEQCHGVEMPHPPDWMPGHARPAFQRPSVCWRCHAGPELREAGAHPYAMCNRCHRFPGPHGDTAQWVRRHGAAAAKEPGIVGRTRCGLCHTNPRFCDVCHEGRQERVDYR